jgi:hypothetical protein
MPMIDEARLGCPVGVQGFTLRRIDSSTARLISGLEVSMRTCRNVAFLLLVGSLFVASQATGRARTMRTTYNTPPICSEPGCWCDISFPTSMFSAYCGEGMPDDFEEQCFAFCDDPCGGGPCGVQDWSADEGEGSCTCRPRDGFVGDPCFDEYCADPNSENYRWGCVFTYCQA